MRNFEAFTTENGIASLILREIPYQKTAYIRVQFASDSEALIKECVQFCIAVGAERIYGTGHAVLKNYPHHTDILKMTMAVNKEVLPNAYVFPATEETIEHWREIYNEKMRNVPNSSFFTAKDGKKLLADHAAYFVHKDGVLLGIGSVHGDSIGAVASVCKGAGEQIVEALCSIIDSDAVSLEVASVNQKAVELYQRIGFRCVSLISSWYTLYEETK